LPEKVYTYYAIVFLRGYVMDCLFTLSQLLKIGFVVLYQSVNYGPVSSSGS